jgi:hypothetical protein
MAQSTFPAGGGGSVIKSVQRGTAATAGTITITAVDTAKTFVRSLSISSAGTIAGSGYFAGNASGGGGIMSAGGYGQAGGSGGGAPSYVGSFTSGTTSLKVAEYGVSLTNSTTLTATGPCQWEVVEFS